MFKFNLGVVLFLCVSSLNVYTLVGSSWASNSKYSFLGGIRGAAQTISYEVKLFLLIFIPRIFVFSFNLNLMRGDFRLLWA